MNMGVSQLLEVLVESNTQAADLLLWVAGTFSVAFPIFLLVLITTFVFRYWLRPWARSLLWSLVLIRLILPVSVASNFSAQILWSLIPYIRSRFAGSPEVQIYGLANTTFSESMISITHPSRHSETTFARIADNLPPELFLSLQALLIMGSMLLTGLMILTFVTLCRWLRYGQVQTDLFIRNEISDAQRALGVGGHIRLRTVHQLTFTATFDWFRPIILIPEKFALLPKTAQSILLKHEVARIRRGDSGTSLLLAVVRIFHWWNPLFWWAEFSWKRDRELACDEFLMNYLNTEETAEFNHLLMSMRESRPKRFQPAIETPGFILDGGSDSMLRRRIKNLSRPNRLESRSQYWFSWCVIAIMAVCGLTDPVKARLQDTPILLPPGTIWNESVPSEAIRETTETRTYQVTENLLGVRALLPNWSEEKLVGQLEKSINSLLSPAFSTAIPNHSEDGGSEKLSTSCRVSGRDLVVEATPTRHDQVKRLLFEWGSNNRQQVCVEIRSISTRRALTSLLPKMGGHVVESGVLFHRLAPSLKDEPGDAIWTRASAAHQMPMSVFVQRLTPADVDSIVNEAKHQRWKTLFAPKVTMFNGSVATVSDYRIRPFVTSFSTTPASIEPKITNVTEGTEFHAFAFAESQGVELRLQWRQSTIHDVQRQTLYLHSSKNHAQVPHVHDMLLQSSATLKSGDTLLLAPLVRDANGELTIILVTPTIIEPSQ